jgi:hypothetical protein
MRDSFKIPAHLIDGFTKAFNSGNPDDAEAFLKSLERFCNKQKKQRLKEEEAE